MNLQLILSLFLLAAPLTAGPQDVTASLTATTSQTATASGTATVGVNSMSIETTSKPPWWATLAMWITATLTAIGAYLARVIGVGAGQLAAAMLARIGVKLDAEREAEIGRFVEERVLAAEERHAAGKFKEIGQKGATKAAEVVGAVLERFPKLSRFDADMKIAAAVAKLPNVGATGKR